MRHLIVGIDTGKTLAFACLDLDGRLVFSDHIASQGVEWLISELGKRGIPSVISCDREPNDIVRKVASAFNAKIYHPKNELTIDQKMEIAKPLGIRNPHERDACAAAVKAYNSYANKLKQAEHAARTSGVENVDVIKAKVIERFSIDEAITNRKANRK